MDTCSRVNFYNNNKNKSWSPLIAHGNSICGFWWFGHWYNTTRLSSGEYYYGAYPHGFVDRVMLLFKDILDRSDSRILHLFSGTIIGDNNKSITFDINPKVSPNAVGDAQQLDIYFPNSYFDIILADPPYDNNYVKYGTEKFSRKSVVSKCSIILKSGGFLLWLDTIIPQWRKVDGWLYRGNIGIAMSTNHKARALTILQKDEKI